MRKSNIARIAALLLVVHSRSLHGQTVLSVQDFFEDILRNPPSSAIPFETLERTVRPLETASASEVAETLASIRMAARHKNPTVQTSAVLALMDIALARPDSAMLLTEQLDVLEEMLNHQDARIAESALMMLSSLRPLPPAPVIPILLRFAERQDAQTTRQAMALTNALKVEKTAVEMKRPSQIQLIVPSVAQFSQRNLDRQSMIALLDGIGLVRGGDPRLTAIVVSAMQNTNASVRASSLYNLMRLGGEEVRRVSLDVERLRTQDPDGEVRAEADKALRVMGGESQFPPRQTKQ